MTSSSVACAGTMCLGEFGDIRGAQDAKQPQDSKMFFCLGASSPNLH